ncbi:MAG: 2-C-methyl-D-erythritol 2,4-cyclodiphosphate synthase [Candidatus Omnitrophica bacterium]|nr:2-C-methyl-D-erythritol 2,4-cyclodiphosphate synthase [Candidatus Omnitrophota bacterium]
MEYRIGIGYDIHRLVEGRKLFIGGIEIPYIKGLLGHSDADALLHAICDALLGAAAEGDIGELFPDTDPKYHNIPSIELLKIVNDLIKKKGYTINNIDTVVIAQEPILSPFKSRMEERIAQSLNIKKENVNIKAKTNEGLDDIGRKEAIAAYAVVIIKPREVQ